jgi:demethylmenaquinone methyltransferase/2-methoxy-6-polyprenyl-1,4-benzoquinol methylase
VSSSSSDTSSPGSRRADEETVRRLAGTAAREAVRAPSPAEKATAIRRMFSVVAPRYDLLNHLLSLNIDRSWRRRTVDRLLERCDPGATILDSCAGTLDLARELAGRETFRGRVVACDFTLQMLVHGRSKKPPLPVGIACADALRLPFTDGSLDGAMVGFGVRNLAGLDAGLDEFARVLRPHAPLVILEFATPPRQPLRAAYLFYFRRILPQVGRLISGHGSAYTYLPESVLGFPEPDAFAERMRAAGFDDVVWETVTGGIAAIHAGLRRPNP